MLRTRSIGESRTNRGDIYLFTLIKSQAILPPFRWLERLLINKVRKPPTRLDTRPDSVAMPLSVVRARFLAQLLSVVLLFDPLIQ